MDGWKSGWPEGWMVKWMVASTYIRFHCRQLSAPDAVILCSTLTIDPSTPLSDPTCQVPRILSFNMLT